MNKCPECKRRIRKAEHDIRVILKRVSTATGVSREELKAHTRKKRIVDARTLAIGMAARKGYTEERIGITYKLDPSTINWAKKRFKASVELRRLCSIIEQRDRFAALKGRRCNFRLRLESPLFPIKRRRKTPPRPEVQTAQEQGLASA